MVLQRPPLHIPPAPLHVPHPSRAHDPIQARGPTRRTESSSLSQHAAPISGHPLKMQRRISAETPSGAGGWDLRCVQRYVQFGLREASPPPLQDAGSGSGATIAGAAAITLTTTKAQEAWTYLRYNHVDDEDDVAPKNAAGKSRRERDPKARIKPRVKTTSPRRPGPRSPTSFSPISSPPSSTSSAARDKSTSPRAGARSFGRTGIGLGWGRALRTVQAEVIEKASHMVPLERVTETARLLAGWVEDQVRGFRGERESLEQGYDSSGAGVKSEIKGFGTILGLSERWMSDVKKPLRGSRRRAKL
ncbi:hypothetical protein BJY01DRAFT_227968 [Aspergillus pseudoustus]|uniref:Uncharacterized protein n=1 Tax=Aspergillus pseudoustus TaxID=1810923 RepID=A0ABR4INL7_9EURO